MNTTTAALLSALGVLAALFAWRWSAMARGARAEDGSLGEAGGLRASPLQIGLGFVTNFFDTLGIGSFAPTTAIIKLRRLATDEQIPGTLNVGYALPIVVQAFIFISAVAVGSVTLVSMIAAAVLGAWLGSGVVTRMPRRAIQIGMGIALAIAGGIFLLVNLDLLPGGGEALHLSGGKLVFAVGANFVLGALMTLGVGMYAPCLILVSLLGMNPIAAFPIMMGSCAFLMPMAGMRFIRTRRFDARLAAGLAIGGVPGVLVAAFLVKSLPIIWLRWLVTVVVLYAAIVMLRSAFNDSQSPPAVVT